MFGGKAARKVKMHNTAAAVAHATRMAIVLRPTRSPDIASPYWVTLLIMADGHGLGLKIGGLHVQAEKATLALDEGQGWARNPYKW